MYNIFYVYEWFIVKQMKCSMSGKVAEIEKELFQRGINFSYQFIRIMIAT